MQAGVNARSGWGHRRARRLAVVSPANRREATDVWQNSDVRSAIPRTSISATKGESRSCSAGPIPSLRDDAISGDAPDRGRKSRNDRPTLRWRSRPRSTRALSALTTTVGQRPHLASARKARRKRRARAPIAATVAVGRCVAAIPIGALIPSTSPRHACRTHRDFAGALLTLDARDDRHASADPRPQAQRGAQPRNAPLPYAPRISRQSDEGGRDDRSRWRYGRRARGC